MHKTWTRALRLGSVLILAACASQTANAAAYVVNQNGITFDFSTNLANLNNLSGVDISSSITSNSFLTNVPSDNAGFPIDTTNSYLESGFNIIVSTNGSGVLTALQVTGTYFASYPAFPGENPFDFFCTWGVPSGTLTQDNDAGFCPSTATTNVNFGTFSSSSVPEPTSATMFSGGMVLLAGLYAFGRKRFLGQRS